MNVEEQVRMIEPRVVALVDDLERSGALGPLGLTLTDEIDFDTYEALGRFLGRLRDMTAWALGDWMIYGDLVFGDKIAQAVEETGRAKSTLANYWRVAAAIPKPRRRELSWSHHLEVAALPVDQQDRWLAEAEEARWSVEEFRGKVKAIPVEGENRSTSSESTPGRTGKDELRKAAAAVWHQGQRDGDVYRVPVDVMARLGSALGYH